MSDYCGPKLSHYCGPKLVIFGSKLRIFVPKLVIFGKFWQYQIKSYDKISRILNVTTFHRIFKTSCAFLEGPSRAIFDQKLRYTVQSV